MASPIAYILYFSLANKDKNNYLAGEEEPTMDGQFPCSQIISGRESEKSC